MKNSWFPDAHGTNADQGGYGSSFANAMWSAYRGSVSIKGRETCKRALLLDEINIFSYPVARKVRISFPNHAGMNKRVAIYDISGRVTARFDKFNSSEIIWEAAMHPPGIYIIHIYATFRTFLALVIL